MASDRNLSNDPAKGQNEAAEPSGYTGTNPATAGPGRTGVRSDTPENRQGQIDPSAPTRGTEGPSTNLGENRPDQPLNAPENKAEAQAEVGMGPVGYGGEDKPMHLQPESQRTGSGAGGFAHGGFEGGVQEAEPRPKAAAAAIPAPNEAQRPSARRGSGHFLFRCADVGYTQCDFQLEGSSPDEMLPKIERHAHDVHHLTEFKQQAEQHVREAIRPAA